MPSLEQILLSLQKITDDKKSQLTSLFEENSSWLQRELDAIRSLIEHNPRDDIPPPEKQRTEDNFGKKRKSPEMALAPVKLSPEQKRALVDCDELLEKAGLPTDLNRLKKEQLLEELEKRGEMSYSMKNLKKDLIDGLKDLLMRIARSETQEHIGAVPLPIEVAPILEDRIVESISPATSSQDLSLRSDDSARAGEVVMAVDSSQGLKTPGRKGSLMAEFRHMLSQQSAAATTIDVQSEFHARQNRHRDSQLRKSQLQALPMVADCDDTASAVEAVEAVASLHEEAVGGGPSPATHCVSPSPSLAMSTAASEKKNKEGEEEEEEAVRRQEGPAAEVEMTAGGEEDSGEVHSPRLPVSEEEGEEAQPLQAEDGEEEEVEEEGEEEKIWQEVTSEDEAVVGEGEASPQEGLLPPPSSSSSSAPAPAPAPSLAKPSNLVTTSFTSSSSSAPRVVKPGTHPGPASFLDKPASAKPVVAALEKARKAKEAEEQRALLKKKEQEQRKAAAAAAAAGLHSSLHSTGGSTASTKSTASSHKTASGTTSGGPPPVPGASAATSGAGAVPVTAMAGKKTGGGLFGGLFSKSTKETAPAPGPGPVAVPVAVAPPAGSQTEAGREDKLSKAMIQSIVHNYQAAVSPSPGPMPPPSSTPTKLFGLHLFSSPGKTAAPVPAPVPAPAAPAPSALPPTAPPAPAAGLVTPAKAVEVMAEDEYQIEDRASSDDEGSDSGTDEEGGEEAKPQQKIPDWARGALLKEALERQYGLHGHVPMDPDAIFPEVTTCSLEEIFGRAEGVSRKYHCRTSSAHWEADKLTLVEKRSYRQHMGYDKGLKAAKA